MDIAAAEEEVARWKLAAEQEAAAGRAIEQDFESQVWTSYELVRSSPLTIYERKIFAVLRMIKRSHYFFRVFFSRLGQRVDLVLDPNFAVWQSVDQWSDLILTIIWRLSLSLSFLLLCLSSLSHPLCCYSLPPLSPLLSSLHFCYSPFPL